jgi:hypothetical protein
MGDAGVSPDARGPMDAPERVPATGQRISGHLPNENVEAEFSKWINCLNSISDDLNPHPDLKQRHQEATRAILALWTQKNRNGDPVITKLTSIEQKVDALAKGTTPKKVTTWAEIAAAAQPARSHIVPPAQRPCVRIRIPDAKDKSASELLEVVKPTIRGAYAIRQLRSGDVDVMVVDQAAKDQAINQQETEGFKILRQDYPIEVQAVPLSLDVQNGKDASNTELIREITQATRKILPNLVISRIRWLHDPKTHEKRKQDGKTRGSLIVTFPTQALQHEAIRKGVIIGSQLYEARLYDHSLQVKQCFRCSAWGHTQGACGKQPRCGTCAGPHQTKDCPKERVSCTNCGRNHKAWQKQECRTFQTYLQGIQANRIALHGQTAAIRASSAAQAALRRDNFQIAEPRKRPRATSFTSQSEESQPAQPQPAQPPKRGPGRPTSFELAARAAARDPTQTRLHATPSQDSLTTSEEMEFVTL